MSWGKKVLYSGSHDSHVIEWDLVEGTAQHKWKADRHAVTFVCCHSNDEIILSAGRSIKMWNLSDYTMLQVGQYIPNHIICSLGCIIMQCCTLRCHAHMIFSDYTCLSAPTWDQCILLYMIICLLSLQKFTGHSTDISWLKFAGEDTFMSAAINDRNVNLWWVEACYRVSSLLVFLQYIHWVSFHRLCIVIRYFFCRRFSTKSRKAVGTISCDEEIKSCDLRVSKSDDVGYCP